MRHTVRARGGRPPERPVRRRGRFGADALHSPHEARGGGPVKNSYTLGRVAGIQIGLNWSVLFLLALLMWTLATSIFPDTNPGLGDNTYFAMAVVASLTFFASILLHELGHAVQARRDGMQIDGITLWMFGGVARFAGMFPSAGAEFRIAVAGPIVSAVLGGGFVAATLIPGLPQSADAVCAWLGFTNLLLLAFNLIPALPLDGGRMLRSALWAWKGDLRTATRIAAGTGRVLALGMIGLGIAITAMGGAASGIWLAIIGWFVLQAAGAEARYVASPPPGMLTVRDMMDVDPVTTAPGLTLEGFAHATAGAPPTIAYPVIDGGRAVGLLPLRCLAEVPRERWAEHRVADCMLDRAHVPTLTAGDGLPAVIAALQGTELESALVLEGDHLVGPDQRRRRGPRAADGRGRRRLGRPGLEGLLEALQARAHHARQTRLDVVVLGVGGRDLAPQHAASARRLHHAHGGAVAREARGCPRSPRTSRRGRPRRGRRAAPPARRRCPSWPCARRRPPRRPRPARTTRPPGPGRRPAPTPHRAGPPRPRPPRSRSPSVPPESPSSGHPTRGRRPCPPIAPRRWRAPGAGCAPPARGR